MIGTKLAHYEITSHLGTGGMGEVYQATDLKLGRSVAIKFLPEAFSHESERVARFEREARVLASLNHANIAAIHGVDEINGRHFLVMELVPGETLAERIKKGPIPIEEALRIAKQIAEALEEAHEKGIIHRDLKPANIKVKEDGTVKVLDFGLAKALSDEVAESDMSNSPTLSMAATRQGVILGTAAYMSPEQAKGKRVDRRTDVWAFGCVLYEMLTGKAAFQGEDVTEILAAIVMKEPAFDALPAKTSSAIRMLLRRCLEKNLRRRLGHMPEARIILEDVLSGVMPPEAEVAPATARKSRERLLAGAVVITAIIAALGWGAFAYFRSAPQQPETMRFFVSPPDGWNVTHLRGAIGLSPDPLAVSPDGRQVAFLATNADGITRLWVRSLDTLTAQALAGTEGARSPFWSPDSKSIAFFANGKLKKIDVSGGPALTLCDAPAHRGGTWSRDGVIVFAPIYNAALQKVSAAGGMPSAATVLSKGENAHRGPFFLPDGRHFLYDTPRTEAGGLYAIYVASLDTAEGKLLMRADSQVLYSQGHLLFLRETTLMAQPFDARRLVLTGDAFPIAEQIQTEASPQIGVFSASENGVLAYQTGMAAGGPQLTWFDRAGKQLGVLGDPAFGQTDVQLSPDGKQAAVSIQDPARRTSNTGPPPSDIWIYDVARNLKTRFTFDPADELALTWSPDGKRVVFNSNRKGHMDLYQKAADGSGTEELLFEDNLEKFPASWSPDGRSLYYFTFGNVNTNPGDLFVLPLTGERKPVPFIHSQFNVTLGQVYGFGQLSPDGRWVAYTSNESGRFEVYVVPVPGPGGKRQVSTAGGILPRWRREGAELFYQGVYPDNRLMAAAVNGKGASFEVGAVEPLFEMRRTGTGPRFNYDVSPDGQRFLINTAQAVQAASTPVTVVVNWTAGLKK